MGRIEELVAQGYDVADIQSHGICIAVTLDCGVDREVVRLDEADATEVLFGVAPRSVRRSEFLLTR